MSRFGWTLLVLGLVMSPIELYTANRLGYILINCSQMITGALLICASKLKGGK